MVEGEAPHQKKMLFKNVRTFLNTLFFLESVQIYVQDAECAESKKKQFFHFYFSSYRHFLIIFVTSIPQFSMNFHANSKNKSHKKNVFRFSFYSVHFVSFIKLWPLLREGVCISFPRTGPHCQNLKLINKFNYMMFFFFFWIIILHI